MTEVCAYILMEIETGYVKDVLKALQKVKELESVCVVTGPFDLIAHLSAKSLKELGDIVTTKLQNIEGIVHTTTCVCTDCACGCSCETKK